MTKYFSHELNLFLALKDPDYFQQAVRPLIACKCEKTLLDLFLLGETEALEAFLSPGVVNSLHPLEIVLLIGAFAQSRPEQAQALAAYLRANGDKVKPSTEARNRTFDAVLSIGALSEPQGVEELIHDEIRFNEQDEDEDGFYEDEEKELEIGGMAESIPTIGGAAFGSGSQMQMAMRAEADLMSHTSMMRNVAPPRARGAPMMKKKMEGRAPTNLFGNGMPSGLERPEYEEAEEVKEYSETHYFGVKSLGDMRSRSTHSLFWGDVAEHAAKGHGFKGFLSEHFVLATHSFTELAAVLAFLDLPWKSGDHGFKAKEGRGGEIKAATGMLVFSKELRETRVELENNLIVTVRLSEAGQTASKDPKKMPELLADEGYTAHVVVTNVSPDVQEAQLLMQIPEGAIPLRETSYHRAFPVKLHPYQNSQFAMHFYFPHPGAFPHAPVSLSKPDHRVVALSTPLSYKVVAQLSVPALETFRDILATGDHEAILTFLREEDLLGGHMGFRMADLYFLMKSSGAFWRSAIAILRSRFIFDRTAWSLGILHHDSLAITELLAADKAFQKRVGGHFRSGLLQVEPPDAEWRLLDYHPLINKRAHSRAAILNREFASFYASFVRVLSLQPGPLRPPQRLNLIYYLLLQDRVDEALRQFGRLSAEAARQAAPVQYDYMCAYLDFYTGAETNYAIARDVIQRHLDCPSLGWRMLFKDVQTQLQELDGDATPAEVPDTEEKRIEERRGDAMRRAVNTEPSLSASLEGRKLLIETTNVERFLVKYYPVDLELLFSREPFLTSGGGEKDFSYVKPAEVEEVAVEGRQLVEHRVSENMDKHNMVIEVVAGARKQLLTFFASTLLRVTLLESYGDLKVADARTGKPLPRVYVKVFAKKSGGEAVFHKDGYTDLRGRFDYATLSSSSGLKGIEKFALLVCSDELGALTREAKPPAGHRGGEKI